MLPQNVFINSVCLGVAMSRRMWYTRLTPRPTEGRGNFSIPERMKVMSSKRSPRNNVAGSETAECMPMDFTSLALCQQYAPPVRKPEHTSRLVYRGVVIDVPTDIMRGLVTALSDGRALLGEFPEKLSEWENAHKEITATLPKTIAAINAERDTAMKVAYESGNFAAVADIAVKAAAASAAAEKAVNDHALTKPSQPVLHFVATTTGKKGRGANKRGTAKVTWADYPKKPLALTRRGSDAALILLPSGEFWNVHECRMTCERKQVTDNNTGQTWYEMTLNTLTAFNPAATAQVPISNTRSAIEAAMLVKLGAPETTRTNGWQGMGKIVNPLPIGAPESLRAAVNVK